MMNALAAIPVYNEERCLSCVLERTLACGVNVLVVDDGSTDGTAKVLEAFPQVTVIRHEVNRGYGAALLAAFRYTCQHDYDAVVTLDSDGQHEPSLIPAMLDQLGGHDIVSGSRYLEDFAVDTPAPQDRRRINRIVTDELNACFGLNLTDSFCGFKAYRVSALCTMRLTETGYGMPLELWVQAAFHRMRIKEIAVPRVYLDPSRTFGAVLDDATARLAYYQSVIDRAIAHIRTVSGDQRWSHPGPALQR